MFHSIFRTIVACNVLLGAATVSNADVAQMIEICTLCRCLEDFEDSTVIVQCLGNRRNERASRYIDLRNIVWPVANNANSEPPKVRAFFRDLELQYLPKIPTSANVVEMNFDNDSIKSLMAEPFSNFKNLETLTLTNNNLGIMEKDFFATANNLVHLDLSNNSLTVVTALEHARFKKLQTIDLSNNKLKSVSTHLIRALESASIVRLQNCGIYNWESNGATRWKVLNLSWNKLTGISVNTFSNLEQLEELYLAYNEIHVIEPLAFENLKQLDRLDLSHNSILNLEANLILPDSLHFVSVAGNSIERWPFGKIPTSLRVLEIQDNELFDISTGQPVDVLILNASNNRLELFLGDSFPELTELDLSFNSLTNIPRNLGKQLSTLILDGNPLDTVFFESETPLKLLSLNRMPNIVEIDAFSFWKLVGSDDSNERECVEVRISNCPNLRHIDPKAFEETTLCKLDLSYNQLTSIPHELIEWKSLQGGVNLQGNPLDCSCSEQWLVDEILPLLYEHVDLQYLLDDMRCASPPDRNGKRVVKYLNHRGAFCGGPKMERLQMVPVRTPSVLRSDEAVQAGFANIICNDDDEACLHAHAGLGLIIISVVVAITLILSITMIIYILIRRRRELRRNTSDNVWLMHRTNYK